jgi:2-methylcitrate dehydratase PrpD
MEPLAEKFADFFYDVGYEDLPEPVVGAAKRSILDLVGVAIGGLEMPFPQMVVDYLGTLGGKAEATLLGHAEKKIPAQNAALGNGVCAHALDMDDGFRYGGVHPSVATIPAALAAGEVENAGGKAIILATVLGSEIMTRLAKAMNPSHLSRGFHTTGTLGPFGATAAAGKICGLTRDQFVWALGLAGLQSAGLLEILHDGAMSKPIHPGKAAMAGILSVEFARRGAQGPASILEGEKGFFKAMADRVNLDELLIGLGDRFFITDQYIKLHAACRHVHPAIDAVLKIKTDHAIRFEEIASIKIATYPVAISFCGTGPLPESPAAAKFHLSFSAALSAYFGDAGMNRFCDETVQNRDIKDLAGRITAEASDRWAGVYPDQRGASLDLTTRDGRRFSVDVALPKGEPENPASTQDLLTKFRSNASRMPADSCERLIAVIMDLEDHAASDITIYFKDIE